MKFKIPYNIRRALIRTASFTTLAIMFMSCGKDYRDIVIDWDWIHDWPNPRVVGEYAKRPDVRSVKIRFIPSLSTTAYDVPEFRRACDSLDACIAQDPNIVTCGGTILVGHSGAGLPSDTAYVYGMSGNDSSRFAELGANVIRYYDWDGHSK